MEIITIKNSQKIVITSDGSLVNVIANHVEFERPSKGQCKAVCVAVITLTFCTLQLYLCIKQVQ